MPPQGIPEKRKAEFIAELDGMKVFMDEILKRKAQTMSSQKKHEVLCEIARLTMEVHKIPPRIHTLEQLEYRRDIAVRISKLGEEVIFYYDMHDVIETKN